MLNRLKKLQLVRRVSKQKKKYRNLRRQLIIEMLDERLPLTIETQLVKDINAFPDYLGSEPTSLVVVGSVVYFTASTEISGRELWISDGTNSGTVLVKDIWPGSQSSGPKYLTNIDGILYFQANDGTNGLELWKSDGTVSGTIMVKDIQGTLPYPNIPGIDGPRYLTNVNGTVYFGADNNTNGFELWKSDGTAEGTMMVRDIFPGVFPSRPKELVNVNGTLYFRAKNGTNGYELWKSDGTEIGTVMVKDIHSSRDSNPSYLTNINGTLFFQADNGVSGNELWKSDGTGSGTVLVKDIRTGSSSSKPRILTEVNGTLYFRANDGINGYELWRSDGTSEGTFMVMNIDAGNTNSYPSYLSNINGTLYFGAARSNLNEIGLWKSDGTTLGTVLVKNVFPRYLTNVNGTIYFGSSDGINGVELWKSDGTSNGTVMVKDIHLGLWSSYPRSLTNVNGTLFFIPYDGVGGYGYELWKSNGTDDGTVIVKEIRSGSSSAFPKYLTDVNGTIYFSVSDGRDRDELWETDGTSTGTKLVKNIRAFNWSSYPKYLTNVNGTLFFQANDGTNGIELWKSDGTDAGTSMVKDIRPGSNDSNPNNFTNINGLLYFTANDGTNGFQLWKSDGTGPGTAMVKLIRGTSVSDPRYLTNVSGTLFFGVYGSNDGELWKSDGTEVGTVPVKRFSVGVSPGSVTPGNLTNVNGILFFQARDRSINNGNELWKSDGTAVGTTALDIRPGELSSDPREFVNIGGTLYFTANDGANGRELWKSDGTTVGTTLVNDIQKGITGSNARNLTNVNGLLFFQANNGTNGYELWKSDGTAEGTIMLKDIREGNNSSDPKYFTNFMGILYFSANSGLGSELWKSDGTKTGTQSLANFVPRSTIFEPKNLLPVGWDIYYTSISDEYGVELWKLRENKSPSEIFLSSSVVAENGGVNSAIGTLRTADPNSGDMFIYTLAAGSGDTDNAAFNINSSILRATNSFDFESKSSYTVRIRSTDQGGLFTEKSFAISVTDINERPNDVNLSPKTIMENVGTNATVGTLSTIDPDFGSSFIYTLVTGNGDADNAAFNVSGSTLRATNALNFETKSNYTVRVRSTDQGGLFTEKAFAITVTDVNESPSDIDLSPKSVAENAGVNASIGTLITTDMDAGNTFAYTLVAGIGDTDNADFSIIGSTIRAKSSFDFETKSSYAIRLRSTDQGGLFTEKTFIITVTNVNENPYDLDLTPKTIAENSGANATIGTLSTIDPDAVSTFVYTLVAGNGDTDNTAFTINGVALRAKQNLDFETKSSYSVRVRSTDQGGLFTEKTFTITVANVNEIPTNLNITQTTIPENSGADVSVGTFSTIDPDAGSTFVYTLVPGVGDAGNSAFNVNGSTLRATSSFDFETKSSYTIRVRSTDQGGLFTEKTFTISVTNVNETPNDLDISLKSIAENSGANATVGTLTTIDPDAGNTFIYSLVPGAGDADNATFRVSGSTIIANSSFDFETKSNYTLRIRSTDQGGLFTEKAFTIAVTNVNEMPTDLDVSLKTIAENAGANATFGNLTTIDPDIGSAFIYALVAGNGDIDNAAFNIVGSTIRATNSFDFERKSSYSVRMRSTDQGGLFTEKAFLITVVNVNETPTDLDLSPRTIAENVVANSVVGTLRSTDPDSGSTFSYTLVTGAGSTDNESFAIVNDQLKAIPSFDFENKNNYSIRIRTTDAGGLSFEKTLPISILDVNEVPGIQLSNLAISVNESNTTGLVVADVGIMDDALGSNSVSLSGPDASLFEVVGGKLRLKPSQLDFETKPIFRVTVSVDDPTLGSTPDQSIEVVLGVTDVNEAPTEVRLNNLVSRVLEEVTFAQPTLLADVEVVDDALGTSQLVLSGPDSSHFEVRDRKLWLRPGTRFDFETQSTYQARIEAFDPALANSPNVLRNFVLSVDNVPEVTRVTIVDGAGWQESVKRVQIQWDMAVNLSNTAIRWNKSDIDNASVSFATQMYLINGRTLADMQFNGKYADEVGLLDGDYELMVLGDQVTSVSSSLSGLGFVERYQAVRPKNPFEVKIVLASPVGIGSGAIMTAQVVGLNNAGNSIRYEVDWNADGVVDRTVLGGSSISIENVSFATGGSRTITVEAKRAGQSIAKGRSVVDVVPLTTRGSSWFSTLDVDMDSTISPLDVLTLVNRLNETSSTLPYDVRLDVDRDQSISPLDVLAIINRINANAGSGPPTPFVSVAMQDTGASDGLTSTASVTGVVKDAGAKLFVSLDGKPRKEVVGAIQLNGQFDLTDAAMSQLFGSTLEGDHLLTVGTISGGGGWEAMDRRFTRISRLPNAFEILTAVQKDGLRLAWTTAGDGVRYRVIRKVEGQSPIVMADGLAELATRVNLSQGLHDIFVEAYDHLGNTTKTQMLKIQVN